MSGPKAAVRPGTQHLTNQSYGQLKVKVTQRYVAKRKYVRKHLKASNFRKIHLIYDFLLNKSLYSTITN
jgi:hypothetical protein